MPSVSPALTRDAAARFTGSDVTPTPSLITTRPPVAGPPAPLHRAQQGATGGQSPDIHPQTGHQRHSYGQEVKAG